jgi:hypothetical protein
MQFREMYIVQITLERPDQAVRKYVTWGIKLKDMKQCDQQITYSLFELLLVIKG